MKIDNIFPELGINFYQPIPKNGCSTVKNYIFRKRYGFHFPEIAHPIKHGALIHIHHFYPTKQFTHTSRCLVITRNPVVRFQSAFKEKILFNENFSSMNEIIKRVDDILWQVKYNKFENRIIYKHFLPQSYWMAGISLENRFCMDMDNFMPIINGADTRILNDSNIIQKNTRSSSWVNGLKEIICEKSDDICDAYYEDENLVN